MQQKPDYTIKISETFTFDELKDILMKTGIEVTNKKVYDFQNFLSKVFEDNICQHISDELRYLAGEFTANN